MARLGLLVGLASCCFIGLIECQTPGTTTKATAAEISTKPNQITTSITKTAAPKATTAASVDPKSQGVETTVGADRKPSAVGDSGTKQGSDQSGPIDTSPNDSTLSEATLAGKDSSFVIPSNEIKLSGYSGTILQGEENGGDAIPDKVDPANTLAEESKMFGTGEIDAAIESTTKGQSKASFVSPSTDQTMTKSNTESVTGPSTANTVKPSEKPTQTTQKSLTSTVSEVTDSTQGTVAPIVTNIGQVNPTSGTIVFKPGKPNENSKANDPMTTTSQMTTGTGKDNTTPSSGTTLNVIVPSTTGTTEMTQTGTDKTMTPSPNEVKIISDSVLTNEAASSGEDVAMKSDSEIKITEKVADPMPKSVDNVDLNDKSMANNAVEQPGSDTAKTNDAMADQSTSDTVTVQSVADTTMNTGTGSQTDSPVVACSGLLCTNTCPHGREIDEQGCETCKCRFSPDCPTPLPTTRLLCMMQIRLGQSCSSDLDCPVQRICCPGTCGQSCRRRSSSRSRVLAILRKF